MEEEKNQKKKFAKDLEMRTKLFAISIIKLSIRLPDTTEGRVVKYQITKAGTSVGANYREANRARSKADFKNKIKICEGEASECQYWLEIIMEIGWIKSDDLKSEYDESGELLAIFTSIGNNLQ
ncbi:MAG: hypothetical protein A2X13_01425 [Bacteroidetes bacterium GWC2_33_15]|nr:MAG: hypothetical protein A2X10_08200 [Bacteroidetes bacterium GWA2_33_15]OFX52318.1 MAG: hypothetical protein A2X13_01425 [Bacteroidetes bacterium GWC2_33_15]OFX64472.1 MAG: hypothetical protein A2X15_12245 [Bacteroidetes bacterium GWB2_32_14]OFX67877.1 MAG: hypothetical protein A2X14_06070 [Bacteroidetes bacterium GWD2_33_33]HAN19312.1 four helix bundle protein [Bacteroidales bacterium]